jgi:hypothetical protein
MPEPTTFASPQPVDLEVRNPIGTVEVTATDTATATVQVRPLADSDDARELAERTRVDVSGDGRRLIVTVPERRVVFGRGIPIAVSVTVPTGSRARLRTASADSTCRGRLDRLEAHTASGAVTAEEVAGSVEAHVTSGTVHLGATGGAVVRTASGTVRIGSATGDVKVHMTRGRVDIGVAEASVAVHTASGDVSVDEVSRGTIALTAASGNLRVGVRAGAVARLDLHALSGRARSDLPVEDSAPTGGSTVDIKARTTSGNVLVTRAASSPV